METVEQLVASVESGLVLDDVEAEGAIRSAVQTLAQDHQLDCQAEFSHYGSGYASVVDAWFFRREPAFRTREERPLPNKLFELTAARGHDLHRPACRRLLIPLRFLDAPAAEQRYVGPTRRKPT